MSDTEARVMADELPEAWREFTPFHVRKIVRYIADRSDDPYFVEYAEGHLYTRILERIADGSLSRASAKIIAIEALKTQELPHPRDDIRGIER